MSTAIAEYEIGPLNYQIKRDGKKYTLWLDGCRIGRPRADKPGEVWEYSATTLGAAEREMETDAKERLRDRIVALRTTLAAMESTYDDLREKGYGAFKVHQ
jgi:hypothetical protein